MILTLSAGKAVPVPSVSSAPGRTTRMKGSGSGMPTFCGGGSEALWAMSPPHHETPPTNMLLPPRDSSPPRGRRVQCAGAWLPPPGTWVDGSGRASVGLRTASPSSPKLRRREGARLLLSMLVEGWEMGGAGGPLALRPLVQARLAPVRCYASMPGSDPCQSPRQKTWPDI